MAKAVIVDLSDEVAADLTTAAGGFQVGFVAERVYMPRFNFEEINTLKIQVFPFATRIIRPTDRENWEHEYDIDAVVFFRAGPKSEAQAGQKFDDLQKLVEQLADFYKPGRTELTECLFVGAGIGAGSDLPYFHQKIEDQNAFISGIRYTFRKWR